MFGAAAAPPKPVKKAEDIKTKEELAREAAFAAKNKKNQPTDDNANSSSGGGAWKTATKRTSRGLALKARSMGKSVTVSQNRTQIADEDDGDVSMGGMGNKKKKRLYDIYETSLFSFKLTDTFLLSTPYGGRAKAKPAQQNPTAVEQRVDILVRKIIELFNMRF